MTVEDVKHIKGEYSKEGIMKDRAVIDLITKNKEEEEPAINCIWTKFLHTSKAHKKTHPPINEG